MLVNDQDRAGGHVVLEAGAKHLTDFLGHDGVIMCYREGHLAIIERPCSWLG